MRTNDSNALSIWLFHDRRLGHMNQLEGLLNRLEYHTEVEANWIDARQSNFFGKSKIAELVRPTPDLIIGAGHRTHKSMLYYSKKHQAFNCVLMKPSFPNAWFDTIICPEHDRLRSNKHILCTRGALNKIEPKGIEAKDRQLNLMLIGGPSKHYYWQEKELIRQIESICLNNLNKPWILYDSPRTPKSLHYQLEKLGLNNLSYYRYQDPQGSSLNANLAHSQHVWISPDSVSMLYEALTAGCQAALFEM